MCNFLFFSFHDITSCILDFFGSYSKTYIVNVRADWGRVSWGLTVIQTEMNLLLAGLAIWNHCVAASLHRPPSHRTMMYFSWNWGGVKLELEWTSKVFKWSFAQKVLQLFEILIFTLKIHLNLQYLARNCSSLI